MFSKIAGKADALSFPFWTMRIRMMEVASLSLVKQIEGSFAIYVPVILSKFFSLGSLIHTYIY